MAIEFKEVSYVYKGISKGFDDVAMQNINLSIAERGEFVAICGQTGSGKTTLIHHMNALLVPTKGEVRIFDRTIYANKKNKNLKQVRKRVGLVFQFPEYQLFEETVIKDIMFGPTNFGSTKEEARVKAENAARLVGLDEKLFNKSPFRLSGGQMRKVAIAGILAMEPEILVLDEPTRGLDPKGSRLAMELFKELSEKYGMTIILITHNMDIVAEYAKRVIVMNEGSKVYDGPKEELFDDENFNQFHLGLPSSVAAVDYLNEKMKCKLSRKIFSLEELMRELRKNG